MSDKEINETRQILMNEMGLTRESIREEMKAIVEQTMERHVRSLDLERLFNEALDKRVKATWSSEEKILGWIKGKVQLMVQDLMQDKIEVRLKRFLG